MSTACKPGLSWKEAADCADFAQRIVDDAVFWGDSLPESADEAEALVRNYNKRLRSSNKRIRGYFKALYGYSIRGYIPYIVENIGLIVAEMEES